MIIKNDPEEIRNYLTDASNFKGFCEAVYFPESTEDIVEILKYANKRLTPVTVSGNGTGLTGARVPLGGIVISTEKMNSIIHINPEYKYAITQPGVLLSTFQNECKKINLLYPPDPTERNCFVGGTIATNASGEKTFKYGATRNFVLGLEVVLANGEILFLERGKNIAKDYSIRLVCNSGYKYNINLPEYEMPSTKNAAGYFCKKNMDAIDLFIGSEGTLGVITKAKLKLINSTGKVLSVVSFFENEKDALYFIEEAKKKSVSNYSSGLIDALALEFFDSNSLEFLREDYPIIPKNAAAAVWFEQEINNTNENFALESWMNLLNDFNSIDNWFASSEKESGEIQNFRHNISAKINDYISKNNLRKLGTDVAVPDEDFLRFYFYSKKTVEDANLNFVAYGHFGNSHLHLNILPENEDEYILGKKVYSAICNEAIRLKGTVSAEHGIGKLKKEYLLMMFGKDVIDKMKNIKRTLDPNLILGRGNLFDI